MANRPWQLPQGPPRSATDGVRSDQGWGNSSVLSPPEDQPHPRLPWQGLCAPPPNKAFPQAGDSSSPVGVGSLVPPPFYLFIPGHLHALNSSRHEPSKYSHPRARHLRLLILTWVSQSKLKDGVEWRVRDGPRLEYKGTQWGKVPRLISHIYVLSHKDMHRINIGDSYTLNNHYNCSLHVEPWAEMTSGSCAITFFQMFCNEHLL